MKDENISGKVFDSIVLKRLFKFVKPYWKQFLFLVLLTIGVATLGPLRPYLIHIAIDEHVANGNFPGLLNMTILLIGLLVLQGIVTYLHTYISGWLGQYTIKDIRDQLYDHLLSLQLRFFDNTPIGRLVTRTVSDIETLAEVFSQGVAAIIGDVLQLFVITAIMFYTDWRLTLISLSTLPILLFSTYIFKEKIKVAFTDVRNAVAQLNSFVQEHITGMSIVQIFNSEEREYEKFVEINKKHRHANLKSVLYYSIYFPVAEIISAASIGLLVWYGAQEILEDSRVTPGILIAFIMYIQMFFRPIRMIADRFNTLQMGVVSASRIFHLLDSKDQIADNGELITDGIKGDVSFDHVSFAYDEKNFVLKDITFEVKEGHTLALVGATGAGKSSIINLLNRFYDIQKGSIKIDGIPVKDYQLSFLRRNIGVVLQDVFLFSDTIRENIRLGDESITDEQIQDAARLVGALDFIEKLPGGFDYNVMERGATLSVGQRQLISFVRAIVYQPSIIVLDEATSSVDSETEEMIQTAIERLMKGRTAIVIAHRLSTIQNAEKILVLDKGHIVEEGDHQSLLDKNGYYARLHQMQFKSLKGQQV
ncbi:ABC transporter ATP-binding protein [Persicobacter diffluens]|uniref:Xenobiotic ABC transporter ATP-binding protein n=1 Tax=Persicobacter diffluens TaxID=981 RepID=A0AAN5AK84_9BACT|nr:xenobiotic ABC transporter ATP-binding protein [Persicobacter diffluens]